MLGHVAGLVAVQCVPGHGDRVAVPPTGRPPTLATACAKTLAAADQLAEHVGINLPAAFAAMHADATGFLATFPEGDLR